jgi:hypothetical protein
VIGGQNTQPFCHNRIEVILLIKSSKLSLNILFHFLPNETDHVKSNKCHFHIEIVTI